MYTLEEKTVGRFTVEVYADDVFNSWEDVLCDEPMLIFVKDRGGFHVLFDESKQVPQDFGILTCAEDADWLEAIWHADGLAEVETLKEGGVRVDSDYFQRPLYFKTLEVAAKRTVEESIGLDLEDVKVERFSTRDAEVFVAWSQKELDAYAGVKDAKAPLQTVRHFLDGDVYGFLVKDADGDVLESCGGFIGDWEYCMAEGECVARSLEADALAEDAKAMEASRADLYADA